MSDLMQGTSGYAIGQIDTATPLINGVSSRAAEHINGPAAAIVQLEQTLGSGLTLKGTVADLATRLAVALAATGTINVTGFTGLTIDRGLMATSSTEMQVSNHTPIGSEMCWPSDVIPAGWLLENGQAVSRTTYAKL